LLGPGGVVPRGALQAAEEGGALEDGGDAGPVVWWCGVFVGLDR
jgi:hypothetical protein